MREPRFRPPWPFRANTGSPHWRGLIQWFAGGGSYRDLVSGGLLTAGGSPTVSTFIEHATREGMAYRTIPNNNYYSFPPLTVPVPFTIAWWGIRVGTANHIIYQSSDGLSSNHRGVQLALGGGAAGVWYCRYNDASGQNRAANGPATLPTATILHLVAVCRGATDWSLYIDGVAVTPSYSGSGGAIATGSGNGTLGRGPNSVNAQDAYTIDLRVWDRALEDHEVKALYAPDTRWDLYWVPDRRAYARASTGGTGAVSATLGAVTLAATGTLAIAGAATPTLGAVTSAAAGTVALTGAVGATLGAVSLSASGALAIAGAATPTLSAVTLSATGAIVLAGQVAATLGDVTLAATGTVAIVGAAAATLGAVTTTATGVLPIHGVVAATLNPIVAGAEGDLDDGSATGTLNGQLAAVTLSATGVLPIVGTATPALGDLTLAASGAVALAGQVAATLGAVTTTATGATGASGAVAATLAPVTLAATATLALQGIGGSTLEAVTLAATGAQGVAGVVAATLAPVTAAATGALALRGQVSATLAAIGLQATGGRAVVVNLAVVNERLLIAGVTAEAFRRAGVTTEAFRRPGVTAELLDAD